MTKQTLRALSLGFFLSALVVAGFQILEQPEAAKGVDMGPETADTSSAVLEEEKASDSSYIAETDTEDTEEEANKEEDGAAEKAEDVSSEDSAETDLEEETNEPVTITVKEGQPSSVVASQLKEQGIIEDSFEFDEYLEKNNYATKIRPGKYDVTKDMDFEKIVDVLLKR